MQEKSDLLDENDKLKEENEYLQKEKKVEHISHNNKERSKSRGRDA